jgi:hypothetical protein
MLFDKLRNLAAELTAEQRVRFGVADMIQRAAELEYLAADDETKAAMRTLGIVEKLS